MSADDASQPLRIALNVRDPVLAERLASMLSHVPGLELVGADALADLALTVSTSAAVAAAAGEIALTPREIEVLALLAEGASNKVIARQLGISVYTAKFHVGSLIEKLDAIGRTDAVTHAARLGLIAL